MIKKFASSSIIYAGSALLFSVVRQLIFFPLLNKISPDLFVQISFTIILIDLLVYTFGAAIADFYVKSVIGNNKQEGLYRFLFYFSFVSLSTVFIFLFYNIVFYISILLSIYILLYVLNTLQMKVFFNNLQFYKNYLYIFIRIIPYLFLLFYSSYINIESFFIFVLCLLFTEFLAFYLFKKDLMKIGFLYLQSDVVKNYGVIKFLFIYLLLSLVLRLDMFMIEIFFPEMFAEYYQIVSVFMIAVTPITMLTSASLLSILTKVDIKVFLKFKYKIILILASISTISGFIFYIISDYVVHLLYPQNSLIGVLNLFPFVVIFFTLLFMVSKTFLIKYTASNKILLLNITILILPLLFISNFISFIYAFFIIRGLVYIIAMSQIKLKDTECSSKN